MPNKDSDLDSGVLSRSGKKRALEVVQKLAKDLVDLKDGEFASLNLDADLREQIQIARDVKTHAARRRALRRLCQFVADSDLDDVQRAFNAVVAGRRADAARFKDLEEFREQLIAGDESTVAEVVKMIPNCEAKQLRKLQQQCQKELKDGKSVLASRALFKYLRQASEQSDLRK